MKICHKCRIHTKFQKLHIQKECKNIWDKRLDLVHWEDLEGAGGEGGGEKDGEHM